MLTSIEAKAFEVEAIANYQFTDKRLAAQATQMAAPLIAAVHNSDGFSGLDNNKRLYILGEAILAKELCSTWFKQRRSRDQVLSPAHWTQLRNDIISNNSLACRGCNAGIEKVVIAADSAPHVTPKMVATTLGAIIGAVYEDGGDAAVHSVMQHLGFFNHPLLTILSLPRNFTG